MGNAWQGGCARWAVRFSFKVCWSIQTLNSGGLIVAEGNVDLIVKAAFFPDVDDGLIVDVGAAHPNYLSISASFRKSGWRVIAIDPNPHFCQLQ